MKRMLVKNAIKFEQILIVILFYLITWTSVLTIFSGKPKPWRKSGWGWRSVFYSMSLLIVFRMSRTVPPTGWWWLILCLYERRVNPTHLFSGSSASTWPTSHVVYFGNWSDSTWRKFLDRAREIQEIIVAYSPPCSPSPSSFLWIERKNICTVGYLFQWYGFLQQKVFRSR